MLCQNCNKDITVESKFCRYCGSPQTPAPVQEAPMTPPAVPVQEAPAVTPPAVPVQQPPMAPPVVPTAAAPMMGDATPPPPVQAPADFSATVGNVVNTAGAGLRDAMDTVVDKTKDTVASINADGAMTQKLKSPMMKKYFIIGGGVLAAVIIIALIITLIVMNSPTAVVGRALSNTIGDAQSEIEDITEEIPAILFFEDFQKDEYDMNISYSDGFQDLSINVQSDFGSEKIRAEVSMLGIGGEVMISDKYGTVALDPALVGMLGLSEVYGWDNETIAAELYNAGLIDVDDAEDISLNIFENHTASYEKVNKMLQDCLTDIFKEAEIEAIDKEEMTINGEDITAKGYVIVLDSEMIEERFAEFLDDVFESEDLVNAYIPYASVMMNMGSMDTEYLKEELMYSMTSTLGGVRELEAEVFVYKNRIVSLRSESFGYPARFDLNPDGDVLEYVAAVMDDEEVMVFEASMEDDELIVSYDETYGDSLVMVYDLESDRNNLEISTDYDDYQFTVYSENKDTLLIEAEMDGEVLRIAAEKGGLSGDWFEQPENYTDITELLSLGLLGF